MFSKHFELKNGVKQELSKENQRLNYISVVIS